MSGENVIIRLDVQGDAAAEAALVRVGRRGAASMTELDAATQRLTGGAFRRFGSVAQQAGFQVADFATQVQAGTSASIAFAQQGSQLLGMFGAWGAAAGAAVAIFTPLAGSLLASRDAASDTADMLDRMRSAIGDASDAAVTNIRTLADQVEAYGRLDEQLLSTIRLKAQLRALDARDAAQGGLSSIAGAIGGIPTGYWEDFGEGVQASRFLALRDRFGLAPTDTGALDRMMREFESGSTLDARAASLAEMLRLFDRVGASDNQALREFQSTVVGAALAMRELERAEGEVAATAEFTSRPIAELRAELDALAAAAAGRGAGGRSRAGGAAEDLRAPLLAPQSRPAPYWMNNDDFLPTFGEQLDAWGALEVGVERFGDAATRALDGAIMRVRDLTDLGNLAIQTFAQLGVSMFTQELLKPGLSALMGVGLNLARIGLGGALGPQTSPLPAARPGGAFGGDFIVPGFGGADSVTAMMKLSPGERVSVRRRGDGGGISVTNHFHGMGDLRNPAALRPALGAIETAVARAAGRGGRNL